ncbi:hypothetical protein X801_05789, partial [Opisthorchis viverrini]
VISSHEKTLRRAKQLHVITRCATEFHLTFLKDAIPGKPGNTTAAIQNGMDAGYLARQCQVNKGDRVLIYMPMIGECLISMLAAARIGAVHTVVFGGFSPEQLAVRIRNSKVLHRCIILHAQEKTFVSPYLSNFTQCQTLLTSWSGNPKGVVRDSAGYSVALKYSGDKIYDIRPGDVWWAASEFGWVVGHSYCCYAPLIQRATTIIYEGYYDTMDLGYQDEKGFVYILSRADDVINVSGHRLSTSALEEACLAVPDIVDCAVIAISHEVKGHVPFGLLVMSSSSKRSKDDVISAAIASVRKIVGPVAAFRQACVVPKLPKTRSGKISRGSIADMAAGKPVRVPITIEDISVYGPIHDAMKECGLRPTEAPNPG